MRNCTCSIFVLFWLVILSASLFSQQTETADTLYIDGFAISKAFLQELKDVIDYDSTDFLTYELNYYNEILQNEPRLEELKATAERHLSEHKRSYENSEYKSALASYKLYLTYKDSINTIMNARNVTDLNEQYKTAEKQKNIEVMDRENRLKSLSLEKRKQIRFILYIAAAFLVVFLLLTINFVRQKIIRKGRLNKEVIARRKAENELWSKKGELEDQVEKRKIELITVNSRLENELTEIEQLQQQIFTAERLKLVGEMASGMVEVIQNPVRTIVQEVNVFRTENLADDPEVEDMSNILSRAAYKVNDILQKLNQYSLADRTVLKPVDLNAIVKSSVHLFKQRKLGKQIEFKTLLAGKIPRVLLDKVKMEGVLINLILNAIDAIEERGVISLKTSLDESSVCLSIEDNGCGIEASKLNDIFSPFYTTKEKGFGLGLSIINKNITAMQGEINLETEPGKGTRIEICFPLGENNDNR